MNENNNQKQTTKPWYNQGWIWLIVVLLGIGVLFYGFNGIIDNLTQIDSSIHENTAVLKDQNLFLHQIKQEVHRLTDAVKDSASWFYELLNKPNK